MAKKPVDRFVGDADMMKVSPLARVANLLRDKHFTSDLLGHGVTKHQDSGYEDSNLWYFLVSSQH